MKSTVLIFDWDDTLLDVGPQLCQSQYAALMACNDTSRFPFLTSWVIPDYSDLERHIGQRFIETILPSLFPRLNLEDKVQVAWVTAVNHAFRSRYNACPKSLFPGVEDRLHRLHEEGFLLAIATNKSRDLFTTEFEAIESLPALFSFIVCGDDACIAGRYKPQPDMINWIQAQYPTDTQFVMIGDRISDMTAAQNSKLPTGTIFIHPDAPVVNASLSLQSVRELSPSVIFDIIK